MAKVNKKVVSLLDRLFDISVDAKTAAKKEATATKAQLQEAVEQEMDRNPMFLDELSDKDYQELMDIMPQGMRSPEMGGAEDYADETLQMLKDMDAADVAKNLQLFDNVDDIFSVTKDYNPRQIREFMDNVPEEDYDLFGGFEGMMDELGPRVAKAEGGLLIPVEGIPGKEPMLSDDEMEQEYNSFVIDKVLTDDEMEVLDQAVGNTPALQEVIDKIITAATEFTGSGAVEGPGDGTSDSIPARLSDGEFVFTKKAVDQIGVDKLEAMMAEAEAEADRMQKAIGGVVVDPTQTDKMNQQDPSQPQDEEQINKLMLGANRIPSLLTR